VLAEGRPVQLLVRTAAADLECTMPMETKLFSEKNRRDSDDSQESEQMENLLTPTADLKLRKGIELESELLRVVKKGSVLRVVGDTQTLEDGTVRAPVANRTEWNQRLNKWVKPMEPEGWVTLSKQDTIKGIASNLTDNYDGDALAGIGGLLHLSKAATPGATGTAPRKGRAVNMFETDAQVLSLGFQMFDRDNKQEISRDNFHAMLTTETFKEEFNKRTHKVMGTLTELQADWLFDKADKDGDGKLNGTEFADIWKETNAFNPTDKLMQGPPKGFKQRRRSQLFRRTSLIAQTIEATKGKVVRRGSLLARLATKSGVKPSDAKNRAMNNPELMKALEKQTADAMNKLEC